MQEIAVFALGIGAAVYVVRHWFLSSKSGSCGGCKGGCQTKKPREELVQIDLNGSWKP